MLCFLHNLQRFHPESLEMSCTALDYDSWAAILILSNLHVVLHKVPLFCGDRYCKSGNHYITLDCQKATLKKLSLEH